MSRWCLGVGVLSIGLLLGCEAEFAKVVEANEGNRTGDSRALAVDSASEGPARASNDFGDGGGSQVEGAPPQGGNPADLASSPENAGAAAPGMPEAEVGIERAASATQPVGAACDNGVKDGNETDRDCGGDCQPCLDGLACRVGGDCDSRRCVSGRCAEPRCDDQQHNGDETDTDCGGSCAPCANGAGCERDADCASGYCIDGLCRDVECTDGVRSGSETDVDCGGPDCAACDEGSRCEQGTDCLSLVCERTATAAGLRCQPAGCDDGVRNAAESDVDCGGDCEACDDGAVCAADDDCQSRACVDERCAPASCEDGRRNGNEADVDCGGAECTPCAVGLQCSADADCRSNRCMAGTCELGGFGAPCGADGDCLAGLCEAGRCIAGLPGALCREASDCFSARCAGTCLPGDLVIHSNSQISSGPTDGTIQVGLRVSAGPTTYEWAELAFLYFFNPDGAEHLIRVAYEHSQSHEPLAHCADVGFSQWIYVYRTHYDGSVAGQVQLLEQIANDPWSGFDDTNDYSFLASWDENPRIVVCRRYGGRWGLIQGMPPEELADVCRYAEGCEGARRCYPLE